jgi:hypothetical protein
MEITESKPREMDIKVHHFKFLRQIMEEQGLTDHCVYISGNGNGKMCIIGRMAFDLDHSRIFYGQLISLGNGAISDLKFNEIRSRLTQHYGIDDQVLIDLQKIYDAAVDKVVELSNIYDDNGKSISGLPSVLLALDRLIAGNFNVFGKEKSLHPESGAITFTT